jgi:hypothetical protein
MIYFVTFHGGPDNYYDRYGQYVNFHDACQRLIKQAQSTGLFHRLVYANGQHLRMDPQFWPKHGPFVESHPKGYGYWIWKPYIIRQILAQIADNDLLMYCDAGCEIDVRDKDKITLVFEKAKTDLIVGSRVGPEWGYEQMWCKKDLYYFLGFEDNDLALKTQQRQASALCILKCRQTLQLVDEWYQLACQYHFLDDTPSNLPNVANFREHRHDQAIFSLLTKKHKIFSNYSIHEAIRLYRTKNGRSKIMDAVTTKI